MTDAFDQVADDAASDVHRVIERLAQIEDVRARRQAFEEWMMPLPKRLVIAVVAALARTVFKG